jgi:hypothetical protein
MYNIIKPLAASSKTPSLVTSLAMTNSILDKYGWMELVAQISLITASLRTAAFDRIAGIEGFDKSAITNLTRAVSKKNKTACHSFKLLV